MRFDGEVSSRSSQQGEVEQKDACKRSKEEATVAIVAATEQRSKRIDPKESLGSRGISTWEKRRS
jgi:hypothetical protein